MSFQFRKIPSTGLRYAVKIWKNVPCRRPSACETDALSLSYGFSPAKKSRFGLFACLFCLMEAISVPSDHCRAMGYRMRGDDICAGRKGRRPGEAKTPARGQATSANSNWDSSLQPVAAATVRWAPRGHLCHGGRRSPSPDYVGRRGMEDDVCAAQTEGSMIDMGTGQLSGLVNVKGSVYLQ